MNLQIIPQQWRKNGIAYLVEVILIVSLLIGGLSASPLVTSAADAQPAGIEIELKLGSDTALVNGKEIKVQGMYESKGVTMIPVRVLMNAFELNIQFFNSAHEKSFSLNSKSYRDYSAYVKLGALEAQVGGKVVKLPQPAVEKQGSLMVPLRFFAESLEAVVKIDRKNKTIRITRAADILVDGKHRIGSSKDSWSIAAPLYNPSEPTATSLFGFETHPGSWNWSGSLNANSNASFTVTIWTDDGGKPLTEDKALEQLKKQIHTSWFMVQKRTLKTSDGSFVGFVAGHNEPFSVTYSQFWILRLPEKTYYIEIFIGNGSVEKHTWVADQLLPTFRASFDDKDANSKDVTLIKQHATN
ncbi:stalk domain-containing protein [Paenibacillus glycanilyticus]|uniref:stalk domain-containing protein n=1 Tax=Paenibacillus glycanilyticus TaxID=126569 RepID=UPI00191053E4|nr:stalk domain-containing protein [Paenibacillus glycanilyticus]